MSFDVPFLSQYEGIRDSDWQWRGCGIVSLAMVLHYWHAVDPANRNAGVTELLERGRELGAYREGIGWSHAGIAELARQYGYRAYNRDLAPNGRTPMSVSEALEELRRDVSHGPVLASVFEGLDPERGGGHIVVVTGMDDDLISFNDPEQNVEREGRRILAIRSFGRAFKRRTICIIPEHQ